MAGDMSLIATDGGSENERSFTNQSVGSYLAGSVVDDNGAGGFVHIGIEERKVLVNDANKTMPLYGGPNSGFSSQNESDYSSSEEYSSGFSADGKSSQSQYKKSLDFLIEQGVRVKDAPRDSN